MGTIDISKIVFDEIAAMDDGGLVEAKIRENVRKAVLSGIEDALGSYKLRSMVSKKLSEQLPDIIEHIGLDGYNQFLATTIQELTISGMKNEAKNALTKSVTDIFCRRYDRYKLSSLLEEWKRHVDPDDEDERVDRNENHDGYTCRIRKGTSPSGYFEYIRIFLDELGDHPEEAPKSEFEFVVELERSLFGIESDAKINHIYIYGSDIVNNIREVRGSFSGLLANLYLNRTPVVTDLEKIDEDDHYYETERQ